MLKFRKKAAEHDMQGKLACAQSKESCVAAFTVYADEPNGDLGIGASLAWGVRKRPLFVCSSCSAASPSVGWDIVRMAVNAW